MGRKRKMTEIVPRDVITPGVLFSEDELKDMYHVKIEKDYLEVMCGCTSTKFGDSCGKLRVNREGDLWISCNCTIGCKEDKIKPAEFEKHAEKEQNKNWKKNIWVTVKGNKVPLERTSLLKYYKQAHPSKRFVRVTHRDEFLTCPECNKLCRFHCRNEKECRFYHDARLYKKWKCADVPYDNKTCETSDRETKSRRMFSRCPKSSKCRGCDRCYCFGCKMCRFPDCDCSNCLDFKRSNQTV